MVNARPLAAGVFQIGYVVPDLHAAIRFHKEQLGVPEFMAWEDMALQEQAYLGKPGDFRQSIAFGYCGDVQIELIQPLTGVSSYTDYLAKNPRGGVQHIGIKVDDFDAAVAEMRERGYDIVQSGRNGNTRLAYFDTDRDIGTLTEIIYIDPQEWVLFERLKPKRA